MVLLSTKSVQTKKLSKKLDHKIISLYKIKKLVRSLYWLDLSTSIKIHNEFYSNLLQKAANNLLPSQHNISPPPIIVDNKKNRR